MTTPPDAAAVVAYLATTGRTATVQTVAPVLAAEQAAQAAACRWGEVYPGPLGEALCRRVARNLAMRNLPLGVQQDEMGATRIGSSDPEVRRLEGPWRRRTVG